MEGYRGIDEKEDGYRLEGKEIYMRDKSATEAFTHFTKYD